MTRKQAEIIIKFKKLNKNIELNINDFIIRMDGRIEWICSHSVGHTIYSPNNDYVHGCDGIQDKSGRWISCCSKLKVVNYDKKKVIKKEKNR